MNRRKAYRSIIVAALIALTGLLVIQVYWFTNAYSIQEKQFDEKVNLALRNLTDQLLKIDEDSTSRIAAVNRTATNSYHVDFNRNLSYPALDSLVKRVFLQHDLLVPFEVTVYEDVTNRVTFGNFYEDGIMSVGEATCLTRVPPHKIAMDFVVTFPDKKTDVVGGMGIWIFSAFTFLLILILFGVVIIDLSKQKKLAEAKADFINNMTHELQTPISNISIASEVLRKTMHRITEEKASHYADIIYTENQRLKLHVEQVLQTAMLEKGEVELKKSEVNLNSIIEEVVNNFRLRVQSREGQIESRLEALQPLIFGDQLHLANILYSLLDNADKYSPAGPHITITTSNLNHGVLIAIADQGIGIKKDAQQYIFDKFYRVSGSNVHDVKGFGLGLTYVREIVKAHQGKVTVSSEMNKGSLFELYFQNC
jgi:two-component system, OmpR family, phosphate regulon sensor histidine kinase PhoR